MTKEEISATFSAAFQALVVAHEAFAERAMEVSPAKLQVFIELVRLTEQKGAVFSNEPETSHAKVALAKALVGVLLAHSEVGKASIQLSQAEKRARRLLN